MRRFLFLMLFLTFGSLTYAQADLQVSISDGADTYTAGTTSTYTVTVFNAGPNAATNVNVSSLVPDGILPANVTWNGSNASAGTGNLNDVIANLPFNETITYTIVVPVPSNFDQETDLEYSVTVTSDTVDPDPTCDTCNDINEPAPSANMAITNTNCQTHSIVGTQVNYHIYQYCK